MHIVVYVEFFKDKLTLNMLSYFAYEHLRFFLRWSDFC